MHWRDEGGDGSRLGRLREFTFAYQREFEHLRSGTDFASEFRHKECGSNTFLRFYWRIRDRSQVHLMRVSSRCQSQKPAKRPVRVPDLPLSGSRFCPLTADFVTRGGAELQICRRFRFTLGAWNLNFSSFVLCVFSTFLCRGTTLQ